MFYEMNKQFDGRGLGNFRGYYVRGNVLDKCKDRVRIIMILSLFFEKIRKEKISRD